MESANLSPRAGPKVNIMSHLRLLSRALAASGFPDMKRMTTGTYRLYQLYRSNRIIGRDHLDSTKMPTHLAHFCNLGPRISLQIVREKYPRLEHPLLSTIPNRPRLYRS